MSNCLKIPMDIFIENQVTEVKEGYQVYSMQEDGWYDMDEKRIDERAIATNGFPFDNLTQAQERLQNYLSLKNREGLILKRTTITNISPEGPLLRTILITETVVELRDSKEISE